MSRIALRAAALALLLVGVAVAETYQIDRVHSSVQFSVRHMVGRVKGRFKDFGGTVVYDPARPAATRISAVVQVSSIDTDKEKRDRHLRSQDFFWAEKYPTVTFESMATSVAADGGLEVQGNITMRGVTKQITLPVEILGTGIHPMSGRKQVGMATQVHLLRSDFGIDHWTDKAGVIGDEVTVEIIVEANEVTQTNVE